ncbi:uncharacterized protein LOC144610339 [Rhinoraja longicauda]
MDSECGYYIYTSDNRIVRTYRSLNKVILKSMNSNRKAKVNITTHGEDIVSLHFSDRSRTYSCCCTGWGNKRQLKLETKGTSMTEMAFRFKKVVQSDERMYFESCVATGWFIHHAKNKLTVDNDKNNMEAKCFKIQRIDST